MITRGVTILVAHKPEAAQLGTSSLHQLRLVVENMGPMRVALGPRDMADDYDGVLLAPGETYQHPSGDALYARAVLPKKITAPAGQIVVTPNIPLRWIQHTADSPGAARLPGASFPWPDVNTP